MLPQGSEIKVNRSIYLKHLVILVSLVATSVNLVFKNMVCMQRKFVRDSGSPPETNFYVVFREWLHMNFPTLNEIVWSELLEEDENNDYNILGSGIMQAIGDEVIVDNTIPE